MATVVGVAATGGLGSGYLEASLERAVEAGAHFIGCDAGSTDGGPYFLGSGEPKVARSAYKRDLRPMLRAGVARGIPVLMGTSDYSGARSHVAWATELVRQPRPACTRPWTSAASVSGAAGSRPRPATTCGSRPRS